MCVFNLDLYEFLFILIWTHLDRYFGFQFQWSISQGKYSNARSLTGDTENSGKEYGCETEKERDPTSGALSSKLLLCVTEV